MDIPVAVELALERALAFADLRQAGASDSWVAILAVARTTQITAVAAPYAGYLRALTFGRLGHAATRDAATIVDVPLRLFPRITAIDPADALTVAKLEEALLLEIAAISTGRLMTEWVLSAALTARR